MKHQIKLIILNIGQNSSDIRQQNLLLVGIIHNLMSDRQTQKDLSKKLANYKPSHYSRAFSIYQRHKLGKVDPILRAIALPCPLSARFPVYKTLRATVKMLLLNEMELVVMAMVIKQSQWNIQDPIIMENQMGVGEVMCFACDNNDYRRLTLYLLLVGWAAKSALNDDCQEILNEVRRVCFNFKSIFQQWANPYAGVLNLHPAVVNRLYTYYLQSQASVKTDYQLMVDTLLQLSQAYNSQRDNTTTFSSPYLQELPKNNENKPKIFNFQANFLPVDFQKLAKVQERKEIQEMNVFGEKDLTKSIGFAGIFGSSFGGFLSLGSVNMSKKSDLNYFQIQFGEGENNFMVFSQGDPTLSSVMGLRKMNSTTDKFLEHDQDGKSE